MKDGHFVRSFVKEQLKMRVKKMVRKEYLQ